MKRPAQFILREATKHAVFYLDEFCKKKKDAVRLFPLCCNRAKKKNNIKLSSCLYTIKSAVTHTPGVNEALSVKKKLFSSGNVNADPLKWRPQKGKFKHCQGSLVNLEYYKVQCVIFRSINDFCIGKSLTARFTIRVTTLDFK